MSLRELVSELKRSPKIIRSPRLPSELKTEKSYARVIEKYEQLTSPSNFDYQTLIRKLRAVADSGSLEDLSYREMRLAASCLFDGNPHLASNGAFLDLYLDSLRSLRSRLAIKRLIYSYCLHFDPSSSAIRKIAEFLREAISQVSGRWDWPDRHRKYRLFDPNVAPQELANLTGGSASPRVELERIGLTGQLLMSGLAVHVFLDALKAIRKRMTDNPKLDDVNRAISWARGDDGALLFSAHRASLANALLLPFLQRDPNEDIHHKVQNFLLEILGDPRMDKAAWIGADDAADVMIRWLAQATLEQFLKVVDRVAAKQQWDYRRSFWGAYIERRVVTNSWVAFGSEGTQVARQLAKDATDKMLLRFATLDGSGSDQAVLLLQIGDLVVADWSHNGKLRIWRRGNRDAPEFHSRRYVAKALRTHPDFETVHLPPDGWQARAEAYIRRHTNIRLAPADYMPRWKPK